MHLFHHPQYSIQSWNVDFFLNWALWDMEQVHPGVWIMTITMVHPYFSISEVNLLCTLHYNAVIMGALASQITSLTAVYTTVYSRRRSKKTSTFRVCGPCAGNSRSCVRCVISLQPCLGLDCTACSCVYWSPPACHRRYLRPLHSILMWPHCKKIRYPLTRCSVKC